MRKLVLIGLTVTTVFALAAVAVAQYAIPTVTVTAGTTPAKGGSKKKPKNAATKIRFDVNPDSNSTLAGIDYGIPKNLRVSGKGFPKCSASTVNAKGEGACPKNSKVGTGGATTLLGPGKAQIQFAVGVYANGKRGLTLALKQDPAPANGGVQVAFPATIKKNRVAFEIPANVQQPAPGLYSYVTTVEANLGPAKIRKTVKVKKTVRRNGKKKRITVKRKKNFFLVSRIGCTGGKDVFDVKLPLAPNPDPPAITPLVGTTSSPCNS